MSRAPLPSTQTTGGRGAAPVFKWGLSCEDSCSSLFRCWATQRLNQRRTQSPSHQNWDTQEDIPDWFGNSRRQEVITQHAENDYTSSQCPGQKPIMLRGIWGERVLQTNLKCYWLCLSPTLQVCLFPQPPGIICPTVPVLLCHATSKSAAFPPQTLRNTGAALHPFCTFSDSFLQKSFDCAVLCFLGSQESMNVEKHSKQSLKSWSQQHHNNFRQRGNQNNQSCPNK